MRIVQTIKNKATTWKRRENGKILRNDNNYGNEPVYRTIHKNYRTYVNTNNKQSSYFGNYNPLKEPGYSVQKPLGDTKTTIRDYIKVESVREGEIVKFKEKKYIKRDKNMEEVIETEGEVR